MYSLPLNKVSVIKGIAAFRTEFRWISGVSRFPATLITFIFWNSGRSACAAVRAEAVLIYSSALRASPSLWIKFRFSAAAIRAKVSFHLFMAVGTDPAVFGFRFRLPGAAAGTEQIAAFLSAVGTDPALFGFGFRLFGAAVRTE